MTGLPLPPVASGLSGPILGISLAETSNGKFLYAANASSNTVSAFRIELSGALTAIPGQSLPGGAVNLKVSPDGNFLAAAGITSVTMFGIKSDGSLKVGQPFSFGGGIQFLEFNCASNLLFAPLGPNTVAVLKVAIDGGLSHIAGSPFALNNGGALAYVPLLSPDDNNLFVGNRSSVTGTFASIASLNVLQDGSVQELNPLAPIGTEPIGMATNQEGTLLYVIGRAGISLYNSITWLSIGSQGSLNPGGSLNLPSVGLPSVAVYPPKTCILGDAAAERANSLFHRRYGLGGKGYDYSSPLSGIYIDPEQIDSGYMYYAANRNTSGNCVLDLDGKLECDGNLHRDFGIDCSGLVLWSYNTAAGDTTQLVTTSGPILYPYSADQCSTLQSNLLTSGTTAPTGLRPGDLLCFMYHLPNETSPHVAMYLGGGATTEAYDRPTGVVGGVVSTRSTYDPNSGWSNCSPTKTTKCFDFQGYWRPFQARAALAFVSKSPVTLAVTDPDGFRIDAQTWVITEREAVREVPGQLYYVVDSNRDDTVFAPKLKSGAYFIQVVPKLDALPTDSYSLIVTTPTQTLTLAQNVPISEIPSQGYAVTSTGTTISVAQGDTIPPTTTATLSPQPNAAGWNNTNVTATLNSADNEPGGSGVKQITYSATGAQAIASTTVNAASVPILISTEGVTTVSFFATDNAGNVESTKTLTIQLDKTPPSINASRIPAPNANGWNNGTVTVSFQCADSLSGLAAGSPPTPTVLSSEGAGQSVTGTCADVAGNLASAKVAAINIDQTPPTVTCSANPNVLWPPNNQLVPVNLSVAVTDALSGPAGFTLVSVTSNEPDSGQGDIQGFVTGTASTNGQLRAQRLGSGTGRVYTFAYNGTDRAGNAASCTATVAVPHDQSQ